jgi:hypothetical protein
MPDTGTLCCHGRQREEAPGPIVAVNTIISFARVVDVVISTNTQNP